MKVKIKFAHAHNVFRWVEAAREQDVRNTSDAMRVHPTMKLLIDKLSLRNPTWEFWASDYGSTDDFGRCVYSHFTVYNDGEELGSIDLWHNWRTGEKSYEFDNYRLRAARKKHASPRTKDLNKAVKAIVANMYNRTPAERVAAARGTTLSKVANLVGNASYDFRNKREILAPYMTQFIMERWDEFCAIPLPTGNAQLARDKLHASMQAEIDAQSIQAPFVADRGKVLVAAGASFIVSPVTRNDDTAVDVVPLDKLNDRLKGSLGMLKLIDAGGIIPNVGMRVEDNTFYVVDADE